MLAAHFGALAASDGANVVLADCNDLDPSLSRWSQRRASASPEVRPTSMKKLGRGELFLGGSGFLIVDTKVGPMVPDWLLKRSDLVVIPAAPNALEEMRAPLLHVSAALCGTGTLGVVNQANDAPDSEQAKVLEALAKSILPLANDVIMRDTNIPRAMESGQSVLEFAPSSSAAMQMRAVWNQVRDAALTAHAVKRSSLG